MFFVLLKEAIVSILSNKVRSVLTTLGIVVGVFSVSLVISSGDALKIFIINQLQQGGSNLVRIQPGQRTKGPPVDIPDSLKLRDFYILKTQLEGSYKYIFPQMFEQKEITYKGEGRIFGVAATTEQIYESFRPTLEGGRVLRPSDITGGLRVAVIGSNVKQTLFGDEDPIGKRVKVGNVSFVVIGSTKPLGGLFGFFLDSTITIPITAGQQIFGNRDWLNAILIEGNSKEDVPFIRDEATTILRRVHKLQSKDDDFSITTQESILKLVDTLLSVVTIFVGAVAAIALFVGGVGIMNIMYVSVTERTREIGLRKALGAKKSFIFTQFLIESIILTILGGLIGLFLTQGALLLLNFFLGLRVSISLLALLLSIGVPGAFGLIFGFFPALKASRKSPIEALRYE